MKTVTFDDAIWKIVPKEPTGLMEIQPAKDRAGFSPLVAREIYRSMIASVPDYPADVPASQPVAAKSDLLGAIARGWCHKANSHKVMDENLALAIAHEVEKLTFPGVSQPSDDKVLDAAHWRTIKYCALEEAVGLFNGASRYNISEQMAINRIRALQSTPSPIGESKAAEATGHDCPNCFEGKTDFEHQCKICGGTGKPLGIGESKADTPAQVSHDKAGDWPEDFHLENGNYFNECLTCKKQFLGYKRRRMCKVCSEQPASVTLTDSILKEVFMAGFRSPETYNDSVLNDPEVEWEKQRGAILAAHQQKVGGA